MKSLDVFFSICLSNIACNLIGMRDWGQLYAKFFRGQLCDRLFGHA